MANEILYGEVFDTECDTLQIFFQAAHATFQCNLIRQYVIYKG